MEKIKLVALDLDGTLLNSEKGVSPRNKEALEACIQKGVHIVPCTGRTVQGIPEEVRSLPGVRYAITLNGGVVVDMKENKIIAEHKLDNALACEILQFVSQYPLMYDLYIDGWGVSEKRFCDHLDQYKIPKPIQDLILRTRNLVPDIIEYVEEYAKPIEKINLYFGDMELRSQMRKLLSQREDIVVSSSVENNLEVNAVGATKGEGLKALAEYLGLSTEETMGCGDGDNDVTMIQTAGIGVAMGNGEDSLKAMADYVTARNDEDGVAQAIERFVL